MFYVFFVVLVFIYVYMCNDKVWTDVLLFIYVCMISVESERTNNILCGDLGFSLYVCGVVVPRI